MIGSAPGVCSEEEAWILTLSPVSSALASKRKLCTIYLLIAPLPDCWSSLNIDIPLGASFPDLCSQLRTQAPSLFSMETIILFCWAIWIIRNNWTFNGEQFSVRSVRDIFFREMNLKLRIKAGQENLLQSWISESSIASLLTLIFFFSFFVS